MLPRGAIAALRRAAEQDSKGSLKAERVALEARIDARAAPEAERLEKLLQKDADSSWVPDFWEFRRQYAYAPRARQCLELYARLRRKHAKAADDAFGAARSESDRERKRAHWKRIEDEHYASRWYPLVRRWLDQPG
jgi:hypothetical protein